MNRALERLAWKIAMQARDAARAGLRPDGQPDAVAALMAAAGITPARLVDRFRKHCALATGPRTLAAADAIAREDLDDDDHNVSFVMTHCMHMVACQILPLDESALLRAIWEFHKWAADLNRARPGSRFYERIRIVTSDQP